MKRPFALVTMVVALVAQGGYRFPAHNMGYHIGATIIIPSRPSTLTQWKSGVGSAPSANNPRQGSATATITTR